MTTTSEPGTDRDVRLNKLCAEIKSYSADERDAIAKRIASDDLPDNIKNFILTLINRPALALSSPSNHSTTLPAQTRAA
jgi:hypothetical protein